MNMLLSAGITALIVGGVILLLLVIVAGMFIGYYNSFVRKRNNVEEGFSTMDVHLKKRYDLIPNLVETVKGYAKHEKSTLENVVKARNMAAGATNMDDKIQKDSALNGTLKTLFAVAESYPELKADKQFMQLQNQLSTIENEIASARKYYNATVKILNTAIQTFPGVLFAGMYKVKKAALYEVSDTTERENVKVSF